MPENPSKRPCQNPESAQNHPQIMPYMNTERLVLMFAPLAILLLALAVIILPRRLRTEQHIARFWHSTQMPSRLRFIFSFVRQVEREAEGARGDG